MFNFMQMLNPRQMRVPMDVLLHLLNGDVRSMEAWYSFGPAECDRHADLPRTVLVSYRFNLDIGGQIESIKEAIRWMTDRGAKVCSETYDIFMWDLKPAIIKWISETYGVPLGSRHTEELARRTPCGPRATELMQWMVRDKGVPIGPRCVGFAASKDNPCLVRWLMDADAPLHPKDNWLLGGTEHLFVLEWAATKVAFKSNLVWRSMSTPRTALWLIRHGCQFGLGELKAACASGRLEILHAMLASPQCPRRISHGVVDTLAGRKGAQAVAALKKVLEERDASFSTQALHRAIGAGSIGSVRLLIQHGAVPTNECFRRARNYRLSKAFKDEVRTVLVTARISLSLAPSPYVDQDAVPGLLARLQDKGIKEGNAELQQGDILSGLERLTAGSMLRRLRVCLERCRVPRTPVREFRNAARKKLLRTDGQKAPLAVLRFKNAFKTLTVETAVKERLLQLCELPATLPDLAQRLCSAKTAFVSRDGRVWVSPYLWSHVLRRLCLGRGRSVLRRSSQRNFDDLAMIVAEYTGRVGRPFRLLAACSPPRAIEWAHLDPAAFPAGTCYVAWQEHWKRALGK